VPKLILDTAKLDKTIGKFFLIEIQERKTKNWIIHQTLKTTKLDFLGVGYFHCKSKKILKY